MSFSSYFLLKSEKIKLCNWIREWNEQKCKLICFCFWSALIFTLKKNLVLEQKTYLFMSQEELGTFSAPCDIWIPSFIICSSSGMFSFRILVCNSCLAVGNFLPTEFVFHSKIDGTTSAFKHFLLSVQRKSSFLKCLEHTTVFPPICWKR